MLNPSSLFSLCSALAVLSWLILAIAPYNRRIQNILLGGTIMFFGLLYSSLFVTTFDPRVMESFSTLDGVTGLFSQKEAVLVGWIHYLAFDLLAGIFVARDAQKNEVNPWVIRPLFLFIFMAGPLGFALYMIIKSMLKKSYRF